jgi:hypothetical protein
MPTAALVRTSKTLDDPLINISAPPFSRFTLTKRVYHWSNDIVKEFRLYTIRRDPLGQVVDPLAREIPSQPKRELDHLFAQSQSIDKIDREVE